MTEISLQKLAEVVSGKLIGKSEQVVSEIITDSRSFVSSEKSIFFALKSKRNDGHKYINDLYKRGMSNFVVSEYRNQFKELTNARFIIVDNTMDTLHKLAKYYRDTFNSEVLAVIGSNGKTIVKEWLYQLLHDEINIVRSPKSYNSQLGVPLSLCLLEKKYQTGIIEAGISEPDEMENLEKIIKPDTVIFTAFGEAHQENFKNLQEKAIEKLKMCKHAETVIFSPNFQIIADLIKKDKNFNNKNLFTWSLKNKAADLFVEKVAKSETNTNLTVVYKNKAIKYKIPFIDDASVKNSLSCLSYIISQNLLNDSILERFSHLEPIEMRIEQKQGINNCVLINDSYNSDINSLKIAVDLLKNLSKHMDKTIILSDINQSGMSDKDLYETVSKIIKNNNINRFIGIGEKISAHKDFFNEKINSSFYTSTKDFLKDDFIKLFQNEVILLKGSRVFKFEKISEALELKKHRTVLEINLEALTHNFNYYKSLLPPGTKTMVMVKALSYGSGTSKISELLQYHQVDYLGVAIADEGVSLRKAGITTKIMVMNPDENSISDIIDYKLEPEIYSFNILETFLNKLKDYSGIKLPIHIKVDTGMMRLGFCDFEIDALLKKLQNTKLLFVKSVFSHLAASDEPQHDEFTNTQINKFKEICNNFSAGLNYKFIKHIANTSGIERFPNAVFDMVRIGIGLYGFNGADNANLMNVSTLKTRIIQIKTVLKNETVGYGRKWIAKRNSKIAVIPIGYADGLSRKFSNETGSVLINKQKAVIIGNVCMDMCMIDITDIDAKENDEVIIFGDDYPASEIAKKLNTISYEVITRVSERVKRIYLG
ncbi:MAG: bifunctional UDP-N-acetylmuramoyl-tripeptide:D-alanyl-D-alanine ligase/alanine racemase [Bacteroidales bacterium]|nr:bifunctional UDP-N-acetylmuramoyl-tripeptide:D-alanyl-D-alanine ligase/alanine racemase [Bacteroidales bacterium]